MLANAVGQRINGCFRLIRFVTFIRIFVYNFQTMQLTFYKYQGTGNDFVMIDNRKGVFPKDDTALVEKLCDRRFGIGGDGLILLENDDESDFRMVYYNSDGNPSSMCGNGGRCIVAFAKNLGLIQNQTTFIATDGLHDATISDKGIISLQMKEVDAIDITAEFVFLDTGSPHHVQMEDDLPNLDVKTLGAQIRYSDLYGKAGSNVNFVHQENSDTFSLRTYERGVEDETLSCGTGATAVALAMHAIGKTKAETVHLNVEGGQLDVSFHVSNNKFTNVHLIGPAEFVFKGVVEC